MFALYDIFARHKEVGPIMASAIVDDITTGIASELERAIISREIHNAYTDAHLPQVTMFF